MKNYLISTKQNGMTLIEIMVAMTIGLFLLAGVMQIFLGSQQSYRLQENLSRMQENGRFAMDFLTRDIRMAGSMGCVNINNNDVKSRLTPFNSLNSNAIFNEFTKGISNDIFPSNDSYDLNTNKLTLKSMLPTDIFIKAPGPLTQKEVKDSQKNELEVNSNVILKNGDIVMVTNCDKGDIFKITSLDSAREKIGHDQDIKPFSIAYREDAQIYKANFVTYSIKDSSLYRRMNGEDKQVLVENIENMQILYGEDTNDDDTPDYYVSANQVVNMKKVISIRISLLIISPDNNLVTNITPYTYNGDEITPTDKRLRRVFSSTIAIRNKLP